MSPSATAAEELSPVKRALLEIRDLRARLAAADAERHEPVAIVGMSLRVPGGVRDVAGYTAMLWAGTDAITDIPSERWNLADWYDEAQDAPGKMYTRFGGFIDDVDQFDAEFFGIAPVEAASMDPQQRLVLELVWQALEHAGHAPASLAGTSAGVYLGISNSDYGRALFAHADLIDPYFASGGAASVAAGRVSYVLGAHGPAISVDTACSSSLVALHLACQGLRQRECDLALAGGVNLILTPEANINFSKAGMMARDGRCRTFDADASGYVRGEGGGMIVLRRLSDALADGDRILAVVRGSAVNQDGRSNGLTAPNGPSQEAVIRAALASARVAPRLVGYVEAHGTGTSLGDPIEVNALSAVLREGRTPDAAPVVIGSVKTNIGHLEAAAGIAGVIKTVIALQRAEIPPHLHFTTPNPYIDWTAMPMVVPTTPTPWAPIDGRRIGGVSSFGFSGTNAHVVLEAAPDVLPSADALPDPRLQVLALSARDATALRTLVQQYRAVLTTVPADALASVCFTANAGRSHFAHRITVSGDSTAALMAGLDAWLAGVPHPRVIDGVVGATVPRVAFLFPGQGPQYAAMGRALYDSAPAFRRAFDDCAAVFDPLLDHGLRDIVFPADGGSPLLDQTAYAQPAMFAIEYALASLWRAWGVAPAAVLGHSFGEYAAAAVASVVSLADAARMVVTRGRLVAELPGDGLMTVVEASPEELTAMIAQLGGTVAIAAMNGPSNCVISGVRADVVAVMEKCKALGRRVKPLRVSHAFHSPLMDPILDAFEQALAEVRFADAQMTFISTATGGTADLPVLGRTAYWRAHLRNPVRFAQAMQTLAGERVTHFVELSPHPVLLGMAAECVPGGTWLPSLREGEDAWSEMLLTVQRLYADGASIDWAAVCGAHARVDLPTYPFQRKRHWVDVLGGRRPAPVSSESAETPADLWSAAGATLDAQALRGPLDLDAASYPDKWDCLARLSHAQMMHTLHELGVFVRAGESHTLDTILDGAGILPAHRRLIGRWLAHLVEQGWMRRDGDVYMARQNHPRALLPELWAEAEQRFRDDREVFDYVRHCATLLPAILTGHESALESLFPGGSFVLATALYERSAVMRYINGLAASALESISRALPAGRALRVLEIGAGTGGTTSALLPVLPAARTDYLFTDVSDAFLAQGRSRFAAFPQVRFGLYDLNVAPREQGYATGAFDVIVSANCVHASRNLRTTLENLCTLLAPGGLLVLIESTVHYDHHDISTGLIEGWQAFADDLRTDNPLLAPKRWTEAMRAAGFVTAQAWPAHDSSADALGMQVVAARAPGEVSSAHGSSVHGLSAHGTSAVPSTDAAATGIAPPAGFGTGTTDRAGELRGQLTAALPSDRLALMSDAVRVEVMRILRLDADSMPARHDRLMDLGMDSLMAVQLRNALATLLQLDRTLPSTLIFDHPTIDAIATFLLGRSGLLAPVADVAEPAPMRQAAETLGADAIAAMSDEAIAAMLLEREGDA